MFTAEQLEAVLQMSDLGEAEKQRARQMAQAEQLRTGAMGMGPNKRMDWASQTARGLQGVGGLYSGMQTDKSAATATTDKQELLKKLFGRKKEDSSELATGTPYTSDSY